jgi:hypothetical protein
VVEPVIGEVAVKIDVPAVPLKEVLPLRERYRREMSCQIVHDSLHRQPDAATMIERARHALALAS